MDPKRTIYINVIGDKLVGKQRLLVVYKSKVYKGILNDSDKNLLTVSVDGEECMLKLQSTSGHEDYKKIRRKEFLKTDVFLICYAIDDQKSFYNVKKKWYKEVQKINPNAVIILLGTKSDLRSRKKSVISCENGEKLCWEINANKFFECSVKDLDSIDHVFQGAVRSFREECRNKQQPKNQSKALVVSKPCTLF